MSGESWDLAIFIELSLSVLIDRVQWKAMGRGWTANTSFRLLLGISSLIIDVTLLLEGHMHSDWSIVLATK